MDEEKKFKRKKRVKKPDPYACKHGKKKYKLPVPYDSVCKQRYHESVNRYNIQFKSELKFLETMQPTAYEQTRFHRMFAITTLWPPLHTKKEIYYTINKLYKLAERHTRRIEEILKRKN